MLAYTPRSYSEAMAMRLFVTYTYCATYLRGKTGDIITFAKFEEGNLLFETCEDKKSMTKVVTNLMTIKLFHHYLA